MLNNFICAETKSGFQQELINNNVPDNSIAFIKDSKEIYNHGVYYGGGSGSFGISGKINLTSIDEIKTAQRALSKTNEVAFYLVTDSSGKIPSSQNCYDIPSENVKQLSLTSPNSTTNGILSLATANANVSAVGINVGDLIALTRVRVKVNDLTSALGINLNLSGEVEIYQYKVLSMNDAKPTNHSETSAGVMGLMSPWDKGQINKISGIESNFWNYLLKSERLPSHVIWLADVNDCLSTGVYPTCRSELNSPFKNGVYFTCIVNATSTLDGGGYDTIEQTAYGRDNDSGKIFKRIIFKHKDGNDTQFGDWVQLDKLNTITFSGTITFDPTNNVVGLSYFIEPESGFGIGIVLTGEEIGTFFYETDSFYLICSSFFAEVYIDRDTGEQIVDLAPTNTANKDYVDNAIANAITNTLNTEV